VRLRAPAAEPATPGGSTAAPTAAERTAPGGRDPSGLAAPAGEFESYSRLRRFGVDLVSELATGVGDHSPVVPPEYVVQIGDELLLTLWGSVDAELRLTVDRGGRIVVPRVGPIPVAGVRHDALAETIERHVGRVFRNFQLSVTLGRLRGVRVYVTGFVQRPGAYSVPSLSTVVNAVMRAGGPTAAGSFRRIELRRPGQPAAHLDLYDMLLRGDRRGDRLVQADDVIHVAPVGPQVAVRGSVNLAAIFELVPGDRMREVIQMAGGLSAVADMRRLSLERLRDRLDRRVQELELPAALELALENGDIVEAYSAVSAVLSVQQQFRRVRIEGEVARPGDYLLPPTATLMDAVAAAGGMTTAAFPYGTQFLRQSVRDTQQQNYDRALSDLETELARNAGSSRVATSDEASSLNARSHATAALLERLRAQRPTGRIVLEMRPESRELPPLLLEDGDRLLIPPRPSSIGVFGSVFNAGNYLHTPGRTLEEVLRLAGGPTKGADETSVFVVRANGQVVSSRQNSGWLQRGNSIKALAAEPGDTVFMPEELDKTTFTQVARDWTLLLYQLGLGMAGIRSALR
jgi:protein involved in polysaccharide export with SLBB domain